MNRIIVRRTWSSREDYVIYLYAFATKIKEGIMTIGKIIATLKLINDSPIEMT